MWSCEDKILGLLEGDYFPDQVGRVYFLVYRRPEGGQARVHVVFAACYDKRNEEYYVAQQVELFYSERLCGYMHNGPTELDPLTYRSLREAKDSACKLAYQWLGYTWQDEDFWDGTGYNFPHTDLI